MSKSQPSITELPKGLALLHEEDLTETISHSSIHSPADGGYTGQKKSLALW